MVLWLTHSDEFKTVRVAFESKDVKIGETEPLRVWVYDEYFKPIGDADVRIQVSFPDGTSQSLAPHAETTGVFSVPFKSDQLGPHQVRAWVLRNGKKFGEDNLRARVVESHSEDEDLRPDFEALKELARVSGGRFVTADSFSPAVFEEFNRAIEKKVGKKVLLWHSPWVLALLLGAFIAEWILRKRRGLP